MTTAPEIWGIVNVTPDSFSDGGRFLARQSAVDHGTKLLRQGATRIDVGGASSRPRGATYGDGASEVTAAQELERIEQVVAELVRVGASVSVDTFRASVAERALELGAQTINDVSLGRDPVLLDMVAKQGAELVLMHTRADGRIDEDNARYENVVQDVVDELLVAAIRAQTCGVTRSKIWLDPGFGFAKTTEQSSKLFAAITPLQKAGYRVLVGASRKAFLAAACRTADGSVPPPDERLGASIGAALRAAALGVDAVRVHDVLETWQALRIFQGAA